MDIVNAAADAITDHYNSDTPYSEAAESSADLVYEVTDLDGKPMDNMDTMAEKLQQNGFLQNMSIIYMSWQATDMHLQKNRLSNQIHMKALWIWILVWQIQ